MKILLVGSFEHPMYAPAFESGFKALGNEVVTVKYDDYLYFRGNAFPGWRFKQDGHVYPYGC